MLLSSLIVLTALAPQGERALAAQPRLDRPDIRTLSDDPYDPPFEVAPERRPLTPSRTVQAPDLRARDAVEGAGVSNRAPERLAPEYDVTPDGTHWVRGVDYKASFGQDGATFIPFLGSSAPRNFPVRFSVAELRQGAALLELRAPAVDRAGDRITLDQGPVQSEYVALPRGVEQLFVFAAPLGAGDLVLELALETELAAARRGAGWRFDGPLGGVDYGAAFVLDAAGKKLDLPTERSADGFRFTVPAEFLAAAEWPIALDPIISTFTINDTPIDHLQPDIAYDRTLDRFLVVAEEVFSATDHDVRSWFVDGNGAVSSPGAIDLTSAYSARPRVACTDIRRSFLVVYVQGPADGPGRQITGRPRNADTGVIGTSFRVDAGSATDRRHADICGDTFGNASAAHFTVVWQRVWNSSDSDIVVRTVNPDGTFVTTEQLVTNVVNLSDEDPSISKSIPSGNSTAAIVWRRRDSGTNSRIMASVVNFDGTLVRDPFFLSSDIARHATPQVSGAVNVALPSGSGATFLATWSTDFLTDSDVTLRAFQANASNTPNPVLSIESYLDFMQNVDFALDQVTPDVAAVEDGWIVVYSGQFPGATDYVIRADSLNLVGNRLGISERYLPLTITFQDTFVPAIASRHEGGDTGDRGACTVWHQQVAAGAQRDVRAALHLASPVNTCAAQYTFCTSGPNGSNPNRGSFMFATGDLSVTGAKALRAEGMTTNAFGYFLCSLNAQSGISPPGSAGSLCLGGSIGRYSNQILNTGPLGQFQLVINPQALSQPTGPVAAAAGQTWYFQAWHRDFPPGGGAPTSNFTNAVGIPFQ